MTNVIHGQSHKAIKFLRQQPAALAVLWIYASRTNQDNVAWPSVRGLAHDTGWGKEACLKARVFLLEHEALETVEKYVRPGWRKLALAERTRKVNLDKSEYFRPTGRLVIEGKTHPIFYLGGDTSSAIEDESKYPDEGSDVPPDLTSDAAAQGKPSDVPPDLLSDAADDRPGLMSDAADVRPGGTELNTISNLLPSSTQAFPTPEGDSKNNHNIQAPAERGGGEEILGPEKEKDSSMAKDQKPEKEQNTETAMTDTAKLLRSQAVPEAVARAYGWIDEGEVLGLIEQARQKDVRGELRTNKVAYIVGGLKKIDERERAEYARSVAHGLFEGSFDSYVRDMADAATVAVQVVKPATNGNGNGLLHTWPEEEDIFEACNEYSESEL